MRYDWPSFSFGTISSFLSQGLFQRPSLKQPNSSCHSGYKANIWHYPWIRRTVDETCPLFGVGNLLLAMTNLCIFHQHHTSRYETKWDPSINDSKWNPLFKIQLPEDFPPYIWMTPSKQTSISNWRERQSNSWSDDVFSRHKHSNRLKNQFKISTRNDGGWVCTA